MFTKNVPNLYVFLKRHFVAPFVRRGSRNVPFTGEGANELLKLLKAVDDDLFYCGNTRIIKQLATVLKEYENTGDDAGGTGIAADPAFILFTQSVKGSGGDKLRIERFRDIGNPAAPDDWFVHTGIGGKEGNPPHQAFLSENKTEFANPRGLLYIMEDATKEFNNKNTDGFADIEVEVDAIPEGFDATDFEGISEIEKYFDKVVRNTAFGILRKIAGK